MGTVYLWYLKILGLYLMDQRLSVWIFGLCCLGLLEVRIEGHALEHLRFLRGLR